ncbi:MAG: ribonuclease HII [Armatimonadota bacterium]|nr:ribonuclease HII [Armatimonadota bacterium]
MTGSARRLTLTALAAALRADQVDPTELLTDPRAGVRHLAQRWVRRREHARVEAERVAALFAREEAAWARGTAPVAGVDEVGRGPLAGPVVAAAVVFSEVRIIPGLKDSKKLKPGEREALYDQIVRAAAALGIGIADVAEIDRHNILGATGLAWGRAIGSLPEPPGLVLLDGHLRAGIAIPQVTVVRGDAMCASIAAASIVAKVTRDRLMVELDRRFPGYGFARHKGYATADHLAALRRLGPTPEHRRAFLPSDLRQEPLLSLQDAGGRRRA